MRVGAGGQHAVQDILLPQHPEALQESHQGAPFLCPASTPVATDRATPRMLLLTSFVLLPPQSVDSPLLPNFENFPLSQRVTYCFYVGRLAVFDEDYVNPTRADLPPVQLSGKGTERNGQQWKSVGEGPEHRMGSGRGSGMQDLAQSGPRGFSPSCGGRS